MKNKLEYVKYNVKTFFNYMNFCHGAFMVKSLSGTISGKMWQRPEYRYGHRFWPHGVAVLGVAGEQRVTYQSGDLGKVLVHMHADNQAIFNYPKIKKVLLLFVYTTLGARQ